MTMIDTGRQGAKVQSWREKNIRPLLLRMMQQSPNPVLKENRDEIIRAMREFLHSPEGEEYRDSVFDHAINNNYNSLLGEHFAPTARATPAEQAAEREARDAEVKDKIVTRIREEPLSLLDLIMPIGSGKPLRDCTGRECKALSPKMGPWLAKIAAKVKPHQKVGDVLSEAQVRAMYGK